MDWIQVLTVVGANLLLIIGMIGTYVAIWLHQDKKLDAYQKRGDEDRREILSIIRSIQDEMKDFHGRLCAIEERKKTKENT